MKRFLEIILEVLLACLFFFIITVFVDHREANQRLMLLEYMDSLQFEKMKELVKSHNKLVKSHNELVDYVGIREKDGK